MGSTYPPSSPLDAFGVSWLPFVIPLLGFSSSWLYARRNKIDFAKWTTIHNTHHAVAMTLGLCSLWLHTPERINILWSISYFIVDIFDSIVRADVAYIAHHLVCLILGVANYTHPMLFTHRMNSKASFCELSTPFLHRAQATREPWRFVLFALVFTGCRMIWIPIMYWEMLQAGLEWHHPIQLVFKTFYLLNCFWYFKILKILVTGGKKKKEDVTEVHRTKKA